MANEGKAKRFDPYRNFRFKVGIDGTIVAGLNKMSGLKKTTEGIDWWEAGDNFNPRRLPGKTKYEAITLERGLSDDKVFEDWANLVNKYKGNVIALENFRKNIQLHVCDMNGAPQITFNIFDCWVSEFQAVPALDASQNGVAIQSIKLEHEGFERA
jgi:phage tail-like protein